MKIAYYPGCSLHTMSREYDASVRLVCRHLGLKLNEIQDWNCCGTTAAHSLDHQLAIELAGRNIRLAQALGAAVVVTPCAGCFSRLKIALLEMQDPPTGLRVEHMLQFITAALNTVQIRQQVVRPLRGLKLAAYYGCLLTRPAQVAAFDDPEQPMAMDRLLQAMGAATVNWSHKAECCGGGFAASATAIVLDLGGQVLEAAQLAGADAIVAACPMCQANLDIRQSAIAAVCGRQYNLPIIYFTQLMALAFGYTPKQAGLQRHFVNPLPLLAARGVI